MISDIRPARIATRRWPASLHVEVSAREGITRVTGRRQRGPLVLQRPLYPEGGVAHLVMLHPPGGVVGGDTLDVRLAGDGGAECLVTTPGATKFYRGNGCPAVQYQEVKIGDASVEWLPQENIFFDGADAAVRTAIDVGEGARLLFREMNCFGRPASGERFATGRVSSEIRVTAGGRPVLVERFRLWPTSGRGCGAAGMRGHSVQAALLAWPADAAAVDRARDAVADAAFPCAVTLLGRLLVLRALADDAETVRDALTAVWRVLRPVISGRPPVPPRIWMT